MLTFRDRRDAGRRLATRLAGYAAEPDVLVLALPRGGVPVAAEIARVLGAELDVFLVRKLGVPGYPELAFGAIASDGVRVLNDDVVSTMRVTPEAIEAVTSAERQTLERREREYRGDRPRPDIQGRTVILVDDGLATGATMRAAIEVVRRQQPRRIVVAVPVAPPETCRELAAQVDEMVCLLTPAAFFGVSAWYDDFSQTTDFEVRELLESAAKDVRRKTQEPRDR
jgi:putative phosphoribosyl transferase